MSDQVTVPGVGPKPRRTVVIAAVGGVALVGLIVVYRRRRSAQNAGQGAGTATLDTTTGSVGPDGLGFQNPAPVVRNTNVDTTGGQVPTSNAQWMQEALALMPNWDPSFVQTALGKFLDDQPLSSDEANAVRVAEGLVGPPPAGNHVIVMATTASTPGTTTTTTPTPTPQVPDTAYAPQGVNLYDWTAQVAAQYSIPLDLPRLRILNGGSSAATGNPFDHAHIDWIPVPGPPGTPKIPRNRFGTNYRIK